MDKFELAGIVPALRGVLHIELTFSISTDRILNVSADHKSTCERNNILIRLLILSHELEKLRLPLYFNAYQCFRCLTVQVTRVFSPFLSSYLLFGIIFTALCHCFERRQCHLSAITATAATRIDIEMTLVILLTIKFNKNHVVTTPFSVFIRPRCILRR